MHRKTSHRSQIIPKKILHNTTFLLQLQYIAGHSLYHIFHQCESSLFNWLHINKLLENFGNNFELLKWSHTYFLTTSRYYTRSGEVKLRYKDSHACLPRNMMGLIPSLTETEFKEFEPRLKFETQLKYSWFHLKLYSMFQDLSWRSIDLADLRRCSNSLNSDFDFSVFIIPKTKYFLFPAALYLPISFYSYQG